MHTCAIPQGPVTQSETQQPHPSIRLWATELGTSSPAGTFRRPSTRQQGQSHPQIWDPILLPEEPRRARASEGQEGGDELSKSPPPPVHLIFTRSPRGGPVPHQRRKRARDCPEPEPQTAAGKGTPGLPDSGAGSFHQAAPHASRKSGSTQAAGPGLPPTTPEGLPRPSGGRTGPRRAWLGGLGDVPALGVPALDGRPT